MNQKQLVIFDLNKTLIKETSWYEFNLAMGVTETEDETLYRLGPEKEGVLNYHEWIDLLKKIIVKRGKASRPNVEKVLLDYTFSDGAREVVDTLKQQGHPVAIVSGSFNIVVDDVARKLGIEHSYNNVYLAFGQDDMLEDILMTWDDIRFKPLLVQSVCRRFGVHPKDVYYVGDGDNDGDIFDETIGVAIQIPHEQHEPWKAAAFANGETFHATTSHSKATHTISNLRNLLDIVKD